MIERLDERYSKKQMSKEIDRCRHDSRELQNEVSLMAETEQLSSMEEPTSRLKRVGCKTQRIQQISTETMTPKGLKESI